MSESRNSGAETRPLISDIILYIQSRLSGRRELFMGGAFMLGGALALNWSWLVAVGAAPILISVLPCLVMCGLGLCMNKAVGGGSCKKNDAPVSVGKEPPDGGYGEAIPQPSSSPHLPQARPKEESDHA